MDQKMRDQNDRDGNAGLENERPECAYPWTDGQAELTWVAGYILR